MVRTSRTSGTRAVTTKSCGKPVSSDCNAVTDLLNLPGVRSCACNVLVEHRNEITGYKLSTMEDARLDRWTSVGYAHRVLERAGTEGALTVPYRGKKWDYSC